jgi:hypothetical protein
VTGTEGLETVGGVEEDGERGGGDEADEAVEAEAGTGEDKDACE